MTPREVRKELSDHGLSHVGWLRAGPCTGNCRYRHEAGHYHADIEPDIDRFAVYALIIGEQIMRFGIAGSQNSTPQRPNAWNHELRE